MYLAHVAVHTGNRGKSLEAPQSEINKFSHISDPNRRTYAGTRLDDSGTGRDLNQQRNFFVIDFNSVFNNTLFVHNTYIQRVENEKRSIRKS